MKVVWEIKDKDGKVTKRGELNQLATNNFLRIMSRIFSTDSIVLVNENGVSTDFTSVCIGYGNAFVRLGTGTTPPTRSDYRISGSLIAQGAVGYSRDEVGGKVTITFSWTPASDTLVNEVGLFISITGTTSGNYMIDRFLLQQTVPAGQTLTITWIIDLSAL
jgi:hypothetical protein